MRDDHDKIVNTMKTDKGTWVGTEQLDPNAELKEIQQIIDGIDTTCIPISAEDIVCAVCAGVVGSAFELLSIFGNSSNNFVGKAGDKIHHKHKFNHDKQPIDFRGKVDGISFGGPDHRLTTHDIAHYKEMLQQMQDGEFRGGGFARGQAGPASFRTVASKLGNDGTPYLKMSKTEAKMALNKHLFADFFSPKGLPLPFTSDVYSYCTPENIDKIISYVTFFLQKLHTPSKFVNRISNVKAHDIHKVIVDMYAKKGINIRSELEKGLAFAFPEMICRVYIGFVYKKWLSKEEPQYSDSAIDFVMNKILLMAHSIVASVSVGVVCFTECPSHMNIATILRVGHLAIKCVNEQSKLNTNIIAKAHFENLRSQVLCRETFIIVANGYFNTLDVVQFCNSTLFELERRTEERRRHAEYIRDCWKDMKSLPSNDEDIEEIEELVEKNPIRLEQTDTIEKLVNSSSIESEVELNDIIKIVTPY